MWLEIVCAQCHDLFPVMGQRNVTLCYMCQKDPHFRGKGITVRPPGGWPEYNCKDCRRRYPAKVAYVGKSSLCPECRPNIDRGTRCESKPRSSKLGHHVSQSASSAYSLPRGSSSDCVGGAFGSVYEMTMGSKRFDMGIESRHRPSGSNLGNEKNGSSGHKVVNDHTGALDQHGHTCRRMDSPLMVPEPAHKSTQVSNPKNTCEGGETPHSPPAESGLAAHMQRAEGVASQQRHHRFSSSQRGDGNEERADESWMAARLSHTVSKNEQNPHRIVQESATPQLADASQVNKAGQIGATAEDNEGSWHLVKSKRNQEQCESHGQVQSHGRHDMVLNHDTEAIDVLQLERSHGYKCTFPLGLYRCTSAIDVLEKLSDDDFSAEGLEKHSLVLVEEVRINEENEIMGRVTSPCIGWLELASFYFECRMPAPADTTSSLLEISCSDPFQLSIDVIVHDAFDEDSSSEDDGEGNEIPAGTSVEVLELKIYGSRMMGSIATPRFGWINLAQFACKPCSTQTIADTMGHGVKSTHALASEVHRLKGSLRDASLEKEESASATRSAQQQIAHLVKQIEEGRRERERIGGQLKAVQSKATCFADESRRSSQECEVVKVQIARERQEMHNMRGELSSSQQTAVRKAQQLSVEVQQLRAQLDTSKMQAARCHNAKLLAESRVGQLSQELEKERRTRLQIEAAWQQARDSAQQLASQLRACTDEVESAKKERERYSFCACLGKSLMEVCLRGAGRAEAGIRGATDQAI